MVLARLITWPPALQHSMQHTAIIPRHHGLLATAAGDVTQVFNGAQCHSSHTHWGPHLISSPSASTSADTRMSPSLLSTQKKGVMRPATHAMMTAEGRMAGAAGRVGNIQRKGNAAGDARHTPTAANEAHARHAPNPPRM